MARMDSKVERPRRTYVDSSKTTNKILDSGATCYMTP